MLLCGGFCLFVSLFVWFFFFDAVIVLLAPLYTFVHHCVSILYLFDLLDLLLSWYTPNIKVP